MLFNSVDFLIFFPVVTLIYFIVPGKVRYIWLVAASYYFYMCWNAKYVFLLLTSTVVTWFCGWLIYSIKKPVMRMLVLAACLCGNLGILFLFKYFDFFMTNCNRVLSALHIQLWERSFDVLLPVGISFYTFQTLGYVIDVYRGKVEPERIFFAMRFLSPFFHSL